MVTSRMIFWIIILLITNIAFSLPNQSRSCSSSTSISFTGYKIENQLNLKSLSNRYHLIYCNDNKLIYDLNLNGSIPWTQEIKFGNDSIILSRRKSFALRELPIYLPDSLVGGLFFNLRNATTTSTPLISDSLLNNWVEVNHKLDFIYHLPILTTPNIDNKKFQVYEDWDKFISLKENYNYRYDSRNLIRKNCDTIVNQINILLKNGVKSNNVFLNLISISKSLPLHRFSNLLEKFDMLLTYDW